MQSTADPSHERLAAEYCGRQLKSLARQLDGVRRAEDIEHVHQARVASRRLRAALKTLGDCFAAKQVRTWRKAIRRLGRALGPARDADVQIAFVGEFLHHLPSPAYRPGVARRLLRLRQGRTALQREVVKAVDRFEATGVLRQMRTAMIPRARQLRRSGAGYASPEVFRQAQQHILARLERVLSHEHSLADPDDQQRHHAMRIAAKRLRYTMELFKPAYEPVLDPFIGAAKRTQTLLGEMRDCDVWMAQLDAFDREERRRTLEYYGHDRPYELLKTGIHYLRQERQIRRRALFRETADYWSDLSAGGFWGELVRTLRSHVGPADRPAAPILRDPLPAAHTGAG